MKQEGGFKFKRHAVSVNILKRIVLIFAVIGIIAQARTWSMDQGDPNSERYFKNLHQLMEEGIHERFTFVSFTLWHDPPLTQEKMEAIALSADQLHKLAETIPAFRPARLEDESMEYDRKAFDAAAAELSNSAMMLAEAATMKDRARAERLFDRLESSCKNCHAKFNKGLANK